MTGALFPTDCLNVFLLGAVGLFFCPFDQTLFVQPEECESRLSRRSAPWLRAVTVTVSGFRETSAISHSEEWMSEV